VSSDSGNTSTDREVTVPPEYNAVLQAIDDEDDDEDDDELPPVQENGPPKNMALLASGTSGMAAALASPVVADTLSSEERMKEKMQARREALEPKSEDQREVLGSECEDEKENEHRGGCENVPAVEEPLSSDVENKLPKYNAEVSVGTLQTDTIDDRAALNISCMSSLTEAVIAV